MGAQLVVMAAGLGSRYGGIKQIAGVGPRGEILMEYAIYDALEAGFDSVVLVVKPEILLDVERLCGNRLSAVTDLRYAIQQPSNVPSFYTFPADRKKPLGTVHAVLCAADQIDRPFAVINADDYYGKDAFKIMYDGLAALPENGGANMVGYRLKNTVSPYGAVTRGLCSESGGKLSRITETYNICPFPDGTIRDTGSTSEGVELDPDSLVSMNFWGFRPSILGSMRSYFSAFLRGLDPRDLNRECLLPVMIDDMVGAGVLTVDVMHTDSMWFGMTYKDDREKTIQSLASLHEKGLYPATLRG